MKETQITLTYLANTGFLVTDGRKTVLVDGIHSQRSPPFSAIPKEILSRILAGEGAFQKIDWAVFTHLHRDHCAPERISELSNRETRLVLPEGPGAILARRDGRPSAILPDQAGFCRLFQDDILEIEALRTRHDGGDPYNDMAHYSYVLSIGPVRLLFLGDAETGDPDTRALLAGQRFDAVCMNFTELNQAKGRDFMANVIQTPRVLLCHIPLKEDDRFQYQKMVLWNMEKRQKGLPELIPCLDAGTTFRIPDKLGGQ